jgi:hypothetical protein
MSDEMLLSDRVAQAIGDPGAVVDRREAEPVHRWAARAVLTVLVRGRYLDTRPGVFNPASCVWLVALAFVIGLGVGSVFL